jgi:hypothetical protein
MNERNDSTRRSIKMMTKLILHQSLKIQTKKQKELLMMTLNKHSNKKGQYLNIKLK